MVPWWSRRMDGETSCCFYLLTFSSSLNSPVDCLCFQIDCFFMPISSFYCVVSHLSTAFVYSIISSNCLLFHASVGCCLYFTISSILSSLQYAAFVFSDISTNCLVFHLMPLSALIVQFSTCMLSLTNSLSASNCLVIHLLPFV